MRLQEKIGVRSVRLALGLLAGTMLFNVQAQTASDTKIQKVEITGSNIKRINAQTASAVQVITSDEIQKSGATTVRQILEKLTSSSSTLTDVNGSNSFAGGASSISLRSLGKSSTLTLVNGRRVSPYGLADGAQENFINVDTIPADIIERVEVLKDGASAIYGSDAIAGVVNIITKREFKGVSVNGALQHSLKNSHLAKERVGSITGGIGDLAKDGYNALAHVEVFHRAPFSARNVIEDVDDWYKKYINPNFGVRSTFSYPGNFIGRDPKTGKAISEPAPNCAPENLSGGLCVFDQWARVNYSPESKRTNFYSSARKIFTPQLSGFAEFSYSKTQTIYGSTPPLLQPGSSSTWYDGKNQIVRNFVDPVTIPASHPSNPYGFPIPLRYRFADDVGVFKNIVDADQFRLMFGLDGTFGAWDWNAAFGHMGGKAEQVMRGSKHASNYLNAINSGEYKFGGQNSPELLMRMFPTIVIGGEIKTTFLDVKANRELMNLGGGALGLALGVDIRKESFKMYNSQNILNAEIAGFGSTNFDGSRTLFAAFAEVIAPVTKDLELSGAIRADKASTAGASVVPKVGVKFNVNPQILLRSTFAGGFRAPNLAESSNAGSRSSFANNIEDPKRCATAIAQYNILNASSSSVDKADALTARGLGCTVSVGNLTVTNPDVKPEKTRSYTVGAFFQPSKNFSIGLDYFRIDRRDEIGTKPTVQVLSNEDNVPGSVERLSALTPEEVRITTRVKELAPNATNVDFKVPKIAAIRSRWENLDKTRVSGVEIDIRSNWDWGSYGRFDAGLDATYNIDYRGWDTNDNTYTENLVGNYLNYRYKAVLKFGLTKGSWSGGLRINHQAGTTMVTDKYDKINSIAGCASKNIPAEDCDLASDTTVDFSLSYKGFKNTVIGLNMQNMFDRHSLLNIRAGNAPLRGRVVKLSASYSF